ncbi:MAG: hypothetical protein EOP05_00875 [Proteobacteria bacterium]|nr:MAG: hypothetical protein EOP05_00875 [Pseudomonadota bacterium]
MTTDRAASKSEMRTAMVDSLKSDLCVYRKTCNAFPPKAKVLAEDLCESCLKSEICDSAITRARATFRVLAEDEGFEYHPQTETATLKLRTQDAQRRLMELTLDCPAL